MKIFRKRGFTLVEIMIVVAIIGLLAAIAIPNFIRARQRAQENACVANLKQLEGAKMVWAIDRNTASDATMAWADLTPNYLRKTVDCPANGDYTLNSLTTDPTCAIGGNHVL